MSANDEIYLAIGQRIKSVRKSKGMSQEKLAEKTGLSVTHISNVENAHTKASLDAFLKITNALEVSTDVLVCDCVYQSKAIFTDELGDLVKDASEMEIRVVVETARAVLKSLRTLYGKGSES